MYIWCCLTECSLPVLETSVTSELELKGNHDIFTKHLKLHSKLQRTQHQNSLDLQSPSLRYTLGRICKTQGSVPGLGAFSRLAVSRLFAKTPSRDATSLARYKKASPGRRVSQRGDLCEYMAKQTCVGLKSLILGQVQHRPATLNLLEVSFRTPEAPAQLH